MTHNGWKNRATWNVALWIGQDPLYTEAVAFIKDYKGKQPYIDFCTDSGLDTQKTPDKINWISAELDYESLDAMMKELAE